MKRIEKKEDLKVGHYYRTTDEFFRVDTIVDGEPYGTQYDVFQDSPMLLTNYPLSLYTEKVGCIEIFQEEYEETFKRITGVEI